MKMRSRMVKESPKVAADKSNFAGVLERRRLEKELRESQEFSSTILEIVSNPILIVDPNASIRYINPALEKLTGYSPEEVVGCKFPCPWWPEDKLEQYTLDFTQVTRKGPNKMEKLFQKKNGDLFWVEINDTVIRDQDGQVKYDLASWVDITQRKRLEEALRASDEYSSSLMESSPNAVIVINPDTSIRYVNPAFEEINGWTLDEIAGLKVPYPWWPEELKEAFMGGFKTAMEQGNGRSEVIAQKKNGERYWIDMKWSTVKHDAKSSCLLINSMDITDRKRAEEALKESENKYSTLVEKGNDGIVLVQDGLLRFANARILELTNFTLDEVLGKPFVDFVTPEYIDTLLKRRQKRMASESIAPIYEAAITTRDGRRIAVEINANPIEYKGKPADMAIIRDLTWRKRAEEDLQKSNSFNKDLLQNAPNPVLATNLDGSIRYFNPAFEKLTGFTRNELIGRKSPYPCWPNENIQDLENVYGEGRKKDLTSFERNYTKKNGERFWVTSTIKLVKYDADLEYYLSNWVDISERKKAEEELKIREQLYSSLFENMLNGFAYCQIIYEDNQPRDFIYLAVNRAFSKQTGLTDVIGKKVSDVIPGIHQSNPELLQIYARVASERMPENFESYIPEMDMWFSISVYSPEKGYFVAVFDVITDRKRAELKIADSERQYRLVAENVTDVIWKVNIDSPTQLNYISPSITHLLGYTVEEAMNKKMDDVFTPPSFTRAMKALEEEIAEQKEHIEQHRVRTLELELKHKDGSVIAVEVNCAFIQGSDGRPVEILAIARDITERKRAEAQRRQTEENLKAYLENAPDGVYISDSKGTFLYWNKKAEEITGYKREELLGKNFLEAGLLPKKQIATAAKLLILNAAGRPTGPDELELVRKDGSRVRVEVNSTPVRRENKISIVGLVRDITERNKMEVQIRRAAEEWGTTFDSITDFVSIMDKDFKIVRVNRALADALGKRPKDIVGKFCYEVIHKTNEPITKCPYRETLQTKRPVTAEFFEPTLGINLEATTAPILDEKGEIIGCVQVARDVTEREKMQEHLILADRLASVGELASGVAHELNNPLTSILGFTQLLMEKDIADDLKGDLGLVNSEAQRCASIVQNLLTFARKHAPVKQLGQVNDIIEDVLRLRAYERKVHNIEIERRFAPELPEIMVDYFQMQQVFLNLIINAEYFMIQAHNSGLLTIVTERLKSTVTISITDDGPGIPKENLSHLFNPFFTTKEVGKGTGLGLSICHGIVSEHGGKIYATSQSGKGATFVVELPVTID